jgi:hypothetical protein
MKMINRFAAPFQMAFVALLAAMFLFSACKKEEKKDEYKAKFTVNTSGTFVGGAPTVTYKNAAGTDITETITVGTAWIKEVTSNNKFAIYAKVNGTIKDGGVQLELEAFKNGISVELGDYSQSTPYETPINVKVESTFE